MDFPKKKKGSTLYKVHLVVDGTGHEVYQRVMPRKRRVEYPGAMYTVMSRGDRREDIFLDDVDRHDFLKTLAESCQQAGWQVQADCLLRRHYHLVRETPNANWVAGMAWRPSTHTIRLNRNPVSVKNAAN